MCRTRAENAAGHHREDQQRGPHQCTPGEEELAPPTLVGITDRDHGAEELPAGEPNRGTIAKPHLAEDGVNII